MSVVLALLRGIPAWLWVLLAVLAWGGLQKHRADATAKREKAVAIEQANARADAIQGALIHQTKVVQAQQEVIHDATDKARRARVDADRAGNAERRMLARFSAAAGGTAASAAAAGASAPAADAYAVPADVFGRCAGDLRRMAAIADERGIAGQACERAYDALTTVRP